MSNFQHTSTSGEAVSQWSPDVDFAHAVSLSEMVSSVAKGSSCSAMLTGPNSGAVFVGSHVVISDTSSGRTDLVGLRLELAAGDGAKTGTVFAGSDVPIGRDINSGRTDLIVSMGLEDAGGTRCFGDGVCAPFVGVLNIESVLLSVIPLHLFRRLKYTSAFFILAFISSLLRFKSNSRLDKAFNSL